ncbi:hypothetical protein [Nonomuraea basaltis]|uniref:hypothetical protein n=1 Tax=Nonomuraea basaltis TaxID=2495887 RepID=UPI00110C50BA|nr:hypothetical protein [Nonomuraea basaltis]TMR89849.1 hypothetical protein EJK15_58630 [Nonomuraea basaltis]
MKSINGGGAARGMIRVFAVVFLLVLSLTPPPARAHVVEAGADLRVTQTFGTGEVTLVIAGVSQVPGGASWAMVSDGAFLLVGVLVVGGVLTGRLSRPVVGAASASAAVAVVVMLLRPYLLAAQPEGAVPVAEVGRPFVQGRFSTLPARPATGAEFTDGLESVETAGTRYAVSVLPADPLEVRVTSGKAETVTLAEVMPSMGRALPPVATVQADLGRFVAEEKVFVMDGVWELSITLSGDRGEETITVSMLV